ncbi:MAG: hypothetical protein DLM59_04120 [Pseudonocardiales bacterium]|nr:MAG: hypothetical protein DLM59_04120 [Pseudonocardiales bacterium]
MPIIRRGVEGARGSRKRGLSCPAGHLEPADATELTALLVRLRRTLDVDESVGWMLTAGLGLPKAPYESCLIMYRDSAVLTWEQLPGAQPVAVLAGPLVASCVEPHHLIR